MHIDRTRNCPICNGRATRQAFPYATHFYGVSFQYLSCGKCATVFVDPLPSNELLAQMYAKADYHDRHYADVEEAAYKDAAKLLGHYLPTGSRVLDFGCGAGAFLRELVVEGFVAVGVDIDADVALHAGQVANCQTVSAHDFWGKYRGSFDAVHLGDVLEHLPNPTETLQRLLGYLNPGGLLFVEGPIEINPSPVYWVARCYGAVKRLFLPSFTPNHAPTHLMRTSAAQQLAFFQRVEASLYTIYWRVYETGWPYSCGGILKRVVARIAMFVGGKRIAGITLGNRFCGVFVYAKESI